MTAAARKQESRGYGAPFITTSTPRPEFTFEGVDFSIVRRRARHSNRELLDLGRHRLETGEPLNWRAHAYLWARNKRLFRAGVYRDTRGKHWTRYQRTYALRWLETTPTAYFGWLGVTDPTDAQREAVESGIASALMSRAKGFVDPDRAAEMLDVTMAERTALSLRTIGAVDCSREGRKVVAMQHKKEADRARAAAKRAAAGARPHAQSYAAVKPWEAFGESRAAFYRRPKDEREAMLDEASGKAETDSSRINTEKDMASDESVHGEIVTLPVRRVSAASTGSIERAEAPEAANDDTPPPETPADPAADEYESTHTPRGSNELPRFRSAAKTTEGGEQKPPRLDWWNVPDPEFGTGQITLRNMLRGDRVVIRLSDGAVISRDDDTIAVYFDEED
jgi:hypothetical protein